jgi:putative spermidine/putrescine transport system substrate-binding protein
MIKSIKVALLAIVALAFTATAYADFTFVSWGGAYTMSQQKGYIDTWKPVVDGTTKVSVENYNGGLGEVKAQVESGNVTWDVVDILPVDAINGCDEGLLEVLDTSDWQKSPDGKSFNDSIPFNGKTDVSESTGTISPCAAPQIWWTYVVIYDPKAFPGKKPKKMKDFFDVEKFPGKRGVHTWPQAVLEMALVADGVKPSKVNSVLQGEGGTDRAFAKLDELKGHVVHWSAGAQPLELVKSGEVVMSIVYNGRAGAAVLSEGASFDYIWHGQVLDGDWIAIPKGSKNKAEAIEFLKHATTCESQAEQAKYITYAPMRSCGFDIIKKHEPWFPRPGKPNIEILPHMPNTKKRLKNSVLTDPVWWADHNAELKEQWSAWMAHNKK